MMEYCLTPSDDIQAVIDRLPVAEPAKIRLAAGYYRQKLRICHESLEIVGVGRNQTVVAFDDYNFRIHPDGKLFNTFRTPTVLVVADHVAFTDLTIANIAGQGPEIGQAVALSVIGDDFRMDRCALLGYQDTLFCGPLPFDLTVRYQNFLPLEELHVRPSQQLYQNTRIEGTVDFIFGSATALFDHCEIVVLGPGYVTAPSTPSEQPYGLIFRNCLIRNESAAEVYLGRPWREGGSTLFLDCTFTGPIHPDRYHDWEKKVFRFRENPLFPSPLSRSMTEEETERLKHFLAERFQPLRMKKS
ncbi:MAG: pectinesterase family protein [bacterium]